MDAGRTIPTLFDVVIPAEGAVETRRLLRADLSDDDGIAKVGVAVNGEAPIDIAVEGTPKLLVVKEALPLVAGANRIVVTVTDGRGETSSKEVTFRYGLLTAAGGSHSGVIAKDALYTFGRNNVGQLGIGSDEPSKSAPEKIATATTPAAIAFNQNGSAFIDTAGGVWVWGENRSNELGLGTGQGDRKNAPVANADAAGATYLALGYGHMLALMKDGRVLGWGGNEVAQLGGDEVTHPVPTPIAGLPRDVVKIVGGSQHSAALTASGDVWVWGRNEYGNLGAGTIDKDRHATPAKVAALADVVDIASGRDHLLAVSADGYVLSWGLGASGQLGHGDPSGEGEFASPVATPTSVVTSDDGSSGLDGVATVYANGNDSFALKRNGTLWGWGEDGNGTLAQGGAGGPGAAPHKVGHAVRAGVYAVSTGTAEYLDERVKLRSIAVGALHVVAMTSANEVYTWGWSTNGTLGIPDFPAIWRQPTPALVTVP
ncbi:MAG: hypothetical protein KIT84_42290 [Labilithrix sp.]|nr:hypothetical protein [Labilithrix sp.]MCW5817706.1 hypothetical protein [Labilithrix sp.]